ncbi:calcium and calcium/calmodulin-dependent serine/threonine-protein kinase isoform X2 [Tetranychus urticae]|uniref:calcium and calcium/calmodulin-dependent serine/threonine-protein kinase isoform X2 n=1 Tax=Tetranychus urticae TaxID=32264 RepID=UPI00077BFF9C|nr:calcium and calcium/calmodulin-dependent serine/threonine-protein kinase isoform X2 [Tetranychus urticae]
MKTLHRDMGEFEHCFSDISHQPSSMLKASTATVTPTGPANPNLGDSGSMSKHYHDSLGSTSSAWKRREKRESKGLVNRSGRPSGEGKHISSFDESEDEVDEDEPNEDDDQINGEFIGKDEDERRHSNHHSSHHARYSYGKTFSTLYDRLWNILRSAFKKEHKLDQMELFNEACAARLAANYTANKSRRRRELEILCKKTKFTRNELKLLYWGWKCACPNGILTESTFKEIYAQFFPQAGDSSLYAHYVYSAMFNDKVRTANGEVTFSDYASALSTLSRGSTSDKLEWIFKLYDINGDGYLTADEIIEISRAIYALLGYYVSPGHDSKTCEDHGYRVFQKLDTQGKGYITFDEFLLVCSKDETIISSMQLLDTIGLD